jgi:hypothetical protein
MGKYGDKNYCLNETIIRWKRSKNTMEKTINIMG